MTCITGDNTAKMAALMRLLKRDMHGAVAESMTRRGIIYPCNWGVSLPAIRKAAAGFAPDHDFARFLYGQQIRELQLSAYLIANPALVTDVEMAFWGAGLHNHELAENLAFSLLSHTDLPLKTIANWLEDDCPVLLKYCALLTMTKMSGRFSVEEKEYVMSVVEKFTDSPEVMLRNATENILIRLENVD